MQVVVCLQLCVLLNSRFNNFFPRFIDIEDLTVLIQHLESGKRLEIPKQTPNSIAVIIANCWKADPFNRPTFQQLEQLLGDLIEPAVKNCYIEMDEPYRHRNIERFGNSVDIEPSKAGNHLTTGYINLEVIQTSLYALISIWIA